jgi:hypothetical protein
MATNDPKDRALARKELARQLRKDAYQQAKRRRASDPKFIAMKEAVKVRRREMYQQAKARRKAATTTEKTKIQERKVEARAIADQGLMTLVKRTPKDSYDVN